MDDPALAELLEELTSLTQRFTDAGYRRTWWEAPSGTFCWARASR